MMMWRKWMMVAAVVAFQANAATAQTPAPTPAAIGYAKEILTLKGTNAMFAGAVPGSVQRIKGQLLQTNPNYQRDLDEVSVQIAQQLNGREKELGDLMAASYASNFTEQELKDIVTFYKSPLGQKMLAREPQIIQASMVTTNEWAAKFFEEVDKMFRAEMKKRGKDI